METPSNDYFEASFAIEQDWPDNGKRDMLCISESLKIVNRAHEAGFFGRARPHQIEILDIEVPSGLSMTTVPGVKYTLRVEREP